MDISVNLHDLIYALARNEIAKKIKDSRAWEIALILLVLIAAAFAIYFLISAQKEEENFELKALDVSTIEKSLKLRVNGINSTSAPELQAIVN